MKGIAVSLKINLPRAQSKLEKDKYGYELVLYVWNECIPENSIWKSPKKKVLRPEVFQYIWGKKKKSE